MYLPMYTQPNFHNYELACIINKSHFYNKNEKAHWNILPAASQTYSMCPCQSSHISLIFIMCGTHVCTTDVNSIGEGKTLSCKGFSNQFCSAFKSTLRSHLSSLNPIQGIILQSNPMHNIAVPSPHSDYTDMLKGNYMLSWHHYICFQIFRKNIFLSHLK